MHEIAGRQVQAVDLRELHGNLEIGRDFWTWIKVRIDRYGFAEGRDYVKVASPQTGGGRGSSTPRIDYYGTTTVGKELAMVENNAKGMMIRRYFITVEEPFRAGGGARRSRSPRMRFRTKARSRCLKAATGRCGCARSAP
jgi:phage anti-repressor protein